MTFASCVPFARLKSRAHWHQKTLTSKNSCLHNFLDVGLPCHALLTQNCWWHNGCARVKPWKGLRIRKLIFCTIHLQALFIRCFSLVFQGLHSPVIFQQFLFHFLVFFFKRCASVRCQKQNWFPDITCNYHSRWCDVTWLKEIILMSTGSLLLPNWFAGLPKWSKPMLVWFCCCLPNILVVGHVFCWQWSVFLQNHFHGLFVKFVSSVLCMYESSPSPATLCVFPFDFLGTRTRLAKCLFFLAFLGRKLSANKFWVQLRHVYLPAPCSCKSNFTVWRMTGFNFGYVGEKSTCQKCCQRLAFQRTCIFFQWGKAPTVLKKVHLPCKEVSGKPSRFHHGPPVRPWTIETEAPLSQPEDRREEPPEQLQPCENAKIESGVSYPKRVALQALSVCCPTRCPCTWQDLSPRHLPELCRIDDVPEQLWLLVPSPI